VNESIAFVANTYLSAKADADAVEDLCDHLHGLLLSRPPESQAIARGDRTNEISTFL
jgi:hypothetical protein